MSPKSSTSGGGLAPGGYLAKDFESFRRLLLERLTEQSPSWQSRHPADPLMTVVEVLAYAGDQLSYYQDAAATEAYLGTARLRSSVRRHARLLGYRMSPGCGARVWLQVVPDVDRVVLPAKTALQAGRVHSQDGVQGAPAPGALGFETVFEATLVSSLSALTLKRDVDEGSTSAVLAGALADLAPGAVLVLSDDSAQTAARHPVRLVTVTAAGGETRITWPEEDAPRRSFLARSTAVLGNLVLADQGLTRHVALDPVPAGPLRRIRLPVDELAWAEPLPRADLSARLAASTLRPDPLRCLPALTLHGGGATASGAPRRWEPVVDLVQAGPADAVFVVEEEEDGSAWVLFGQHGNGLCPDPGTRLTAALREGRGADGNLPADTEFALFGPQAAVVRSVWSPLPAQGGQERESTSEVRLRAPQGVFRQERLLTASDYAEAAEAIPGVRAVFVQEASSAGLSVFTLALEPDGPLDPTGGLPAALARRVEATLAPWAALGTRFALAAPTLDPVELEIQVTLTPGARAEVVFAEARRALNAWLSDRRPGLGATLHWSQVAALLLQVRGVADLEPSAFRRIGQPEVSGPQIRPSASNSMLDLDFNAGRSALAFIARG